ncbi:MAG TPA: hypothetical protein VKW78_14760 [Terriglobales bacterium]|nr:hypothetical protein [Terriglobales bacterium]
MKLGTNNRRVTVGVFALFAFALLLFTRTIWSSIGSSDTAAAAPVTPVTATRTPASTNTGRKSHLKSADRKTAKNAEPVSPDLDPRLKLGLLELAENTHYAGTGRNIFEDQAEPIIPKPVAPARKQAAQVQQQGPPPPAPPPPINLRYFGFASNSGSPVRKAFLSNGDDVFVAAEGDIVNRRYKIIRINPTSIEIQDVLSNNTQSIPLSQG